MVKLNPLLLVLSLALGTVACGTNDNAPADTGVNGVVGTAGGDAVVQDPPTAADDDTPTTPKELPSTGSPLALTGLLGLVSVAGAIVVRILGRL